MVVICLRKFFFMSLRIITAFLFLSTLGSSMLHAQNDHKYCQHSKQGRLKSGGGGDVQDPQLLRSDTLDIINYDIDLDMTQMGQQLISGKCIIDFRSKLNDVDVINLDLESLQVDSVKAGEQHLLFTHQGPLLHIALPVVLNVDDTYSIAVYYHGNPLQDPVFGGFYFSSGYAFNLGVGFQTDPHNLGRAWFPCFDNFVERSSYSFHVLTSNGKTAYCNGIRTGVDVVGQDSLYTHWYLEQQIPTYLASVAVGSYVHAENSFESITGDEIPIWLTAKASDTTAMKNSMINLVPCLHGFEDLYGPYRWPRVGYCAVPFNGGAMEHATNIAYPLFAINGNLSFETLFAHELAHLWWGDLITCREEGDMWINEGWARFSEAIFTEFIYGQQAYIEYVKDNHKDVMRSAHRSDGARYPVSPIPHAITYGDHVYNKGADMAHTLRGTMGDTDFFTAIRDIMDQKAYSDVSSFDLRDFFQNYTEADLTTFFDQWIFAQGYPEFRVSNYLSPGNDNDWTVTVKQFLHYAPDYYYNVPMQLTAINNTGEKHHVQTMLSGPETLVNVTLPQNFEPIAFYLNDNEAISHAVLAEERAITTTGNNDADFAEMDIDVNSMGSSTGFFVRVENHWAAADEVVPQSEFYVSPDRWWNVITNAPADVDMDATIRYYGNQNQTNYYDSLFFTQLETLGWNEDSLVLVYRPDGNSLWQEHDNYFLNTSPGLSNWTGRFEITGLKRGQYAWAIRSDIVAVNESKTPVFRFRQMQDKLTFNTSGQTGMLHIFDMSGKTVYSATIRDNDEVDTSGWSRGAYTFQWLNNTGDYRFVEKFILH